MPQHFSPFPQMPLVNLQKKERNRDEIVFHMIAHATAHTQGYLRCFQSVLLDLCGACHGTLSTRKEKEPVSWFCSNIRNLEEPQRNPHERNPSYHQIGRHTLE